MRQKWKSIGKCFLRHCVLGWKLRKISFLIALFSTLVIYSQEFSISVDFKLSNFRIEKADSYSVINCLNNTDIRYFSKVGYPKLPYIPFYVLLPHNSEIDGIVIKDSNSETFEGFYDIISTNIENGGSDSTYSGNAEPLEVSIADTLSIYYPSDNQIIRHDPPELYAGFLLNQIYVCPFKYFPETRQLSFYTKLSLEFHLQIDGRPLKLELSPDKIKLSREFIRNMVINKDDIDKTIPLEEKIDYSKIHIFKDTDEDTFKAKKVYVPDKMKTKNAAPFYIKQIN